jgi:hypothetical protein
MNTLTLSSTRRLSPAWVKGASALLIAAGAWALSGAASTAQARDNVQWSIGLHSPGVTVGVSNGPSVVYGYPSYGYPVYDPRPVVVYPRPVVIHRPVVVHSYPVYHGGYHPHWKGHKHGHRGPKRHQRHGGWRD